MGLGLTRDMTRKLLDQEMAFADYVTQLGRDVSYSDSYKRAKHFLTNVYDQWLTDLLSEDSTDTDDQAFLELKASLYPQALSAGFHPKTLLYSNPKTKVGAMTGADTAIDQFVISGEELNAFKELCVASVGCKEDGTGCVLTVQCHLRDNSTGEVHTIERTVDLDPAIRVAKKAIADYHAKLHAEGKDTVISGPGFFDNVFSSIANMANNKATTDLAKAAIPLLALAVPGGQAALSIAAQANQTVQQAKAGNAQAGATVQAVQDSANSGDQQAMKLAILMKTLSVMQDTKDAKTPTATAPKTTASVGAMALISGRRTAPRTAHTVHHPSSNARNQGPPQERGRTQLRPDRSPEHFADTMSAIAQQKQDQLDNAAMWQQQNSGQGANPYGGGGGDGGYNSDPGGYDDPYDSGYDPYSDPFAGMDPGSIDPSMYDPTMPYSQYGFSGWMYNKPYRTPVQAVLGGSPGVGLTLRALFAGGMASLADRARAKLSK